LTRATRLGLAAGSVVLLAAACASNPASGPAEVRSSAPSPRSTLPPQPAKTLTEDQRRALAAHYLAIAQPANRRLDHDLDGQQDAESRGDLAAADADLRDAAVTEREFDRQLAALTFPQPAETFVRLLYKVNQSRATLTATAATAASVPQLRAYQSRLDSANEPVEDAVDVIRDQLGLPPPDTS
jgi:hypothetical protein